MNTKTTLPATTIRQKFFEVLDKIERTGTTYTITRDGLPKAVIMNIEEFDSWQETLDIMSNPELVKGIEESKKELKEGKYSTFEEVFGMTPEEALADKSRAKYGEPKK